MIKPLWTFITNPENFGYFDDPMQTEPAFDPGQVPCPICGLLWTHDDVRTISFVEVDKRKHTKVLSQIAYFYRVHKTCHENMKPEEQSEFETAMSNSTIAN